MSSLIEIFMENSEDFLKEFLNEEKFSTEEISKRQEQIMNAAIKIFSEKGFSAARTSDIAKEAGVAEGTIFRYYKTKRDILLGLILPFISIAFKPFIMKPVEQLIKETEDKSIDDILGALIKDRIKFMEDNKSLIKTVFLESNYDEELLSNFQSKVINYLAPAIDSILKRQIDAGKIKDEDVRLISRSLVSMIAGYFILSRMFPEVYGGEGDEKEASKIADIILNGIRNK